MSDPNTEKSQKSQTTSEAPSLSLPITKHVNILIKAIEKAQAKGVYLLSESANIYNQIQEIQKLLSHDVK